MDGWHSIPLTDVVEKYESNLENGLTDETADLKLQSEGPNMLEETPGPTITSRIASQLSDFLVLILIGASIVSAILGEFVDALVILVIVVINAILGVFQEAKAEKALDALRKMANPVSRVLRNGRQKQIAAKDLVNGDVVLLEAGDKVPADIRLIESWNLKIDESSITGESVPVEKDAATVLEPDSPLGDRVNCAFAGSSVTYGRCRGLVVATGMATQIGSIASMLQSFEKQKTHLQEKLEELGRRMGYLVLGVCMVVFLVGLLRRQPVLEMFLTSVSLAVAAIPEGLPAVVTIVLALGMKRMIERQVIVRKLAAVETLGAVTVICSDKTGTLTQNEMTARRLYVNDNVIDITGEGYKPDGALLKDNERIDPNSSPDLRDLLVYSVLNSDALLHATMDSDSYKSYKIVGDPTEGALVVLGAKAGYEKDDVNKLYPRVYELPFDSIRKRMSTIHKTGDEFISITKGAPDVILSLCKYAKINNVIVELDAQISDRIVEVNHKFASNALRVLAVASKSFAELPVDNDEIEKGMVFIGLVGMIDPPRPEAKEAVRIAERAGVKTIMITGDHKDTAIAIASDLGILRDREAVSGVDLDKMGESELDERANGIAVYARVSPEHKVRIVEALKKNGNIVAMTGDGVNDALALKRSDIGVSMGITGTEVAKGTADMILTDDNFASIVSAVEEGRIIYSNIRKFAFFLLSCNAGEILTIFTAIILGFPVPLEPVQLLWLNLVSDSFPALALGVEKGLDDVMGQHPRDPKESILNGEMILGIALQSVSIAAATLTAFVIGRRIGGVDMGRTNAFITLILGELWRAHTSRSERYSLFRIGLLTNKWAIYATLGSLVLLLLVIYVPALASIFDTTHFRPDNWPILIGLSLVPSMVAEMTKIGLRHYENR